MKPEPITVTPEQLQAQHKKGELLTFVDSLDSMKVKEAYICDVAMLSVPLRALVYLLRMKGMLYIVMAKSDWMNMADNVRSVEQEGVDTVDAYLRKNNVNYLVINACPYGGTKGLSMEAAANRLWRVITGKKVKAKDLI